MRPEELRVAFPYYRHDTAPRPILQNEAPRFSVLSIEADFSSKRPVSVFAWASREHQSKFEVWWLVVHGFGFQGLGLNGLGFPASSWLQGCVLAGRVMIQKPADLQIWSFEFLLQLEYIMPQNLILSIRPLYSVLRLLVRALAEPSPVDAAAVQDSY